MKDQGGKRSRWVRWALCACALLAAIGAGTWFAMPWYVGTRLLPDLWAPYGLLVTADRQEFSLTDGSAQFYGLKVFDAKQEVLSATRLTVRVSLRGLYAGRTVFERVVFVDPVLHVSLGSDGRTNLAKILERGSVGEAATPRPATLWKEVLVHGGALAWDDREHGTQLRIRDVEASVLQTEAGGRLGRPHDRFGQLTLDAHLEQPGGPQAPLSIVHWSESSGGAGSAFVAYAALTGIKLESFPHYIDATQRASLGVKQLDLVVSADVSEGVIGRGAAIATSPGRRRPLSLVFGGPVDDPVFDRSSVLLALLELPFSRLGRVGNVVWETGSSVLGGAVGLVDGVVHGDLLGAGKSVVAGVGGSAVALESNALDAFGEIGRGLGLVAQKVRDIGAIHEQQRALFLTARGKAAQVWSRAHSGIHIGDLAESDPAAKGAP